MTYPKGAYVLIMLRSPMVRRPVEQRYSGPGLYRAFIDMMHDFIESHQTPKTSTESFKEIAEKHMTTQMDLAHNARPDWFFDEWVYGTQIPKYSFKYDMESEGGEKTRV